MRKFQTNNLQICPPHLSDVDTLPMEIKQAIFKIIIHILHILYVTLEENK